LEHFLTFAPSDTAVPPAEGYTALPVLHNIIIPSYYLKFDPSARILAYVPADNFSILFDDDVSSFSTELRMIIQHAFQAASVSTNGNFILWTIREALSDPDRTLSNLEDQPETDNVISITLSSLQSAYYGNFPCPVKLSLPVQLQIVDGVAGSSSLTLFESRSNEVSVDLTAARFEHYDRQMNELREILTQQRIDQEHLLQSQKLFQDTLLSFIKPK